MPEHISAGKARPARKAVNLAAICKPIVSTMWDPRRLTAPQASKVLQKKVERVLNGISNRPI
jgi:hypothetical protein